jgi:hypothetical protein
MPPSATYVLSGVGSTPLVPITQDMLRGTFMLPNIIVNLSNGANLTYTVQQTGDNILAPGYSAASGNWAGITGLTGQTVSANGPLGACCTALRVTITNYVSGNLTFQFIWSGNL